MKLWGAVFAPVAVFAPRTPTRSKQCSGPTSAQKHEEGATRAGWEGGKPGKQDKNKHHKAAHVLLVGQVIELLAIYRLYWYASGWRTVPCPDVHPNARSVSIRRSCCFQHPRTGSPVKTAGRPMTIAQHLNLSSRYM